LCAYSWEKLVAFRPLRFLSPGNDNQTGPCGAKEMAEMEDRWLSVDEISKHLGVSSDTVYRWIEKHSMPAHRLGRLWKFKKDEIDSWVKASGASKQEKAKLQDAAARKNRK